jgi:hypothetical protein
VGQHLILFLHHVSGSYYTIQGGPSGRFVIEADGSVAPIGDEGVTLPSGVSNSDFSSMVAGG